MPKPNAYIETTIPSFYYDLRPDPEMVARRLWTRQWWASARDHYALLTSEVVAEELSAGTSALVPLRLKLLEGLPEIAVTSQVEATAHAYVRHKLMPAHPGGDAFHLALASCFKCDFIVTWNCRHLANPNKFAHIREINHRLGLPTPEIVTPLNLLRRTA
ncbi:MAG TPA: type II toxin-antitoxin system VapC family toxin [Longimicrobium sp.]|nr:type II toxin-antitoxin system VapC family toxin [Longimicrobium sp.]